MEAQRQRQYGYDRRPQQRQYDFGGQQQERWGGGQSCPQQHQRQYRGVGQKP